VDVAAEHLKELISVVRAGFRDNGTRLHNIGSCLIEISGKQDQMVDRVDETLQDIVSEV